MPLNGWLYAIHLKYLTINNNMKKLIINPWEMSHKEALFFVFSVMNEIQKDDRDCVISTKWFWSANVKHNKKSITISTFQSLNHEVSEKRLWKLLQDFVSGLK